MIGAPDVTVIGGGLAGCEAAWQLAIRGIRVVLVEMKPVRYSPAHESPILCELVCSNSLRSNDPMTPAGLLKHELRAAGSLVISTADEYSVPAGSALAVERFGFGRAVTRRLAAHPNVRIERRSLEGLPQGPVIVATGPLTGGHLARQFRRVLGLDRMYFYDAIAPIVSAESIDPETSFRASRWDKDTDIDTDADADARPKGDYINCPMDRDRYREFVEAVVAGRKVVPHNFEEPKFFEGCLPIEVMAGRGLDVLRYGPMRPVGLTDPRTGKWPYAVVQLRPENRYLSAYNMVGFQTRLAYPEQKRVFSLIPALKNAEFLRYGSIHRNTFINAPELLGPGLELKSEPRIRFGGLITGVEGYIESCAMGFLAALFLHGERVGVTVPPPPPETAIGGLYHHISRARAHGEGFSPTNINFGLLPRIAIKAKKKERKRMVAARALECFPAWLAAAGIDDPVIRSAG